MDFVKLKKMQKESRESNYILSDTEAEEQIFNLISYYDIGLDFELDGLLEEVEAGNEKSDDEKQAGNGLKQVLSDIAHFIKLGVLDIKLTDNGLIVEHNLIHPIGEDSENSQSLKVVTYGKMTPATTQKMSQLPDKKYTFSQKAEMLLAYMSGKGIGIINSYWVTDKRAARNIGILLMIAQ